MFKDTIRIGTLVQVSESTANYMQQILPYGFESFSLVFPHDCSGLKMQRLAEEINTVLNGTDAVISSVGIYGNCLKTDATARKIRKPPSL